MSGLGRFLHTASTMEPRNYVGDAALRRSAIVTIL